MPRVPLDEPAELITVKAFASDVAYLKRTLGYGWSAKVRELIREWVKEQREKHG